ncbi:5'-3' exoribonuclease 3-like isoform X2 [Glycine soja]|uniref:5'-3' exoribonuclease 3-like isoform X2 n=1 Tax=Glycine soja TaxID=3848 RepID=UPI00103A83BC|nr:5'-3' exoribonuclease 3-like isoform X2 [Glycine soja]
MGVPSFYRWLVNKYPKVVQDVVDPTMQEDPNGVKFDNLYLDMNAIIHPCFHPDDHDKIPFPTTFEDVFRNVFDYIDRLVETVRPGKLLYMAIDGVAPRAKMNQQRSRRFRAAKDNEIQEAEEERLRKQFETEGKQVLPKQESDVSDSNIITPGTEFMHELSKALKSYISARITSNPLWKDIMVILSDANVPGEGEHKIMSYIRKQRSLEGYDPNTSHCLYGSDADLIMLAMATHEPHFSILREDILIQHQHPKIDAKPFKFLHIWLLREYLGTDMKIEDPPKNCSIEFERIIDDFIFICFFAGNDFLPHMPTLEIHEGAIDLLMNVYKKEFNKLGGYLVDMSRIGEEHAAFLKLSRVEKFILAVGAYEEKIFKKRSETRERYLRRLIRDNEDAKREEVNAACYSDLDDENTSDCTLLIKKAPDSKTLSVLVNNVSATHAEIEQNTKDLKNELKRCIREKCDLFKSGDFLIDKIKLGTPGFKERYFKAKFSVEGPTDIECKRKEIVQKYTEGLVWVLQYYFSSVASWTWFYPFHYGPFASDLKGMGQVRVKFEKGVPFLPLDQLLSVLPPASSHALPKAYSQLMLDEQSRIFDFYPQDFEVDTEGKRFMWQGICILSWIDDKRLVAETRELKNELSENEAIRNSVKADSLFVRSASKLAEKFGSLSLDTNLPCKLETRMSDGIGGILSLCDEFVEKPCLDICDNKKKDSVLCVYYELPAGSNHIPGLLSDVKLPEKTIFESDIMETELWHECQKYYSRFERVQNQDNWRSENTSNTSRFASNAISQRTRIFSSNTPLFTFQGAGVGWGSGRGKRIDAMASESVPNNTKPQHFVDNFRQLRISESNNHFLRPGGGSSLFRPHNKGHTNQSRNAPYHQGSPSNNGYINQPRNAPYHQGSQYNNGYMNQSKTAPNHQGSQYVTVPNFGRGQGRGASSNSSLRPQWSGGKAYQVKDQDRW